METYSFSNDLSSESNQDEPPTLSGITESVTDPERPTELQFESLSEKEDKVNQQISTYCEMEAEQLNLFREAEVLLRRQEDLRVRMESKLNEQAERERLIRRSIGALLEEQEKQSLRVKEAEQGCAELAEKNRELETSFNAWAEKENGLLQRMESIKNEADADRQSRAELTAHLQSQLEEGRKAEQEELKQIEELKSCVDRHTLAERELTAQIQLLAVAEAEQLARIEASEAQRKSAEEQLSAMERDAAERSQKQEEQIAQLGSHVQKLLQEAQEQNALEQSLRNQLEQLEQTVSEQLKRIAAEEVLIKSHETAGEIQQAEIVSLEQKRDQLIVLLQSNQARVAQLSRERDVAEQTLAANIELEHGAEERYKEWLVVAAKRLQQARNHAEAQRMELRRLEEVELQLQKEAELCQQIIDEQTLTVEAKALQLANEQEERLARYDALKDKVLASEAEWPSREKELNDELDRIREEAAQTRQQVESISGEIVVCKENCAESRLQLQSVLDQKQTTEEELSYLLEQGKIELQRLKDANTQLAEARALSQSRAEEEARILDEVQSQLQQDSESRQRFAEQQREAVKAELELQADEEQALIDELHAMREAAGAERVQRLLRQQELQEQLQELAIAEEEHRAAHEKRLEQLAAARSVEQAERERLAETERQLESQIEALTSQNSELQERNQTLGTQVRESHDAWRLEQQENLRLVAETLELQETQASQRRLFAEQEVKRAESEVRLIAEQEQEKLAQLEAVRSQIDARARHHAALEQELTEALQLLRDSEQQQVARILKLRELIKTSETIAQEHAKEIERLQQEQNARCGKNSQLENGQSIQDLEAVLQVEEVKASVTEHDDEDLSDVLEIDLNDFSSGEYAVQTQMGDNDDNNILAVALETDPHEVINVPVGTMKESPSSCARASGASHAKPESGFQSVAEPFQSPAPKVETISHNNFTAESLNGKAKTVERLPGEIGLTPSGSTQLPAELLERLKSDQPDERAAALFVLTKSGEEAFDAIVEMFADPQIQVRNAAAIALSNLTTDRVGNFTRALREAEPEGRRRIGETMATSGIASEAISRLVDGGREKTYDAFSILFLMAKTGVIRPLIDVVENYENLEVRLAVIGLLAFTSQAEILPIFRRLALRVTLPTEIRSALMEAIHQLGTDANPNQNPTIRVA